MRDFWCGGSERLKNSFHAVSVLENGCGRRLGSAFPSFHVGPKGALRVTRRPDILASPDGRPGRSSVVTDADRAATEVVLGVDTHLDVTFN